MVHLLSTHFLMLDLSRLASSAGLYLMWCTHQYLPRPIFKLLSTRIGPACSVLMLTVLWLSTLHIPPPSTSRVTPLTQLHTPLPVLSTPSLYINRSLRTIQNRQSSYTWLSGSTLIESLQYLQPAGWWDKSTVKARPATHTMRFESKLRRRW